MSEERRQLIFTQLDRQTSRARLIQRAMAAYYTALGTFVATTVAIAIFSAAARNFTWIAVLLGVIGTLFMLYGSVLLIIESRMALAAIMTEMDFVWKVSQKYAGKDITTKPGGPFTWLGQKDSVAHRAARRSGWSSSPGVPGSASPLSPLSRGSAPPGRTSADRAAPRRTAATP